MYITTSFHQGRSSTVLKHVTIYSRNSQKTADFNRKSKSEVTLTISELQMKHFVEKIDTTGPCAVTDSSPMTSEMSFSHPVDRVPQKKLKKLNHPLTHLLFDFLLNSKHNMTTSAFLAFKRFQGLHLPR